MKYERDGNWREAGLPHLEQRERPSVLMPVVNHAAEGEADRLRCLHDIIRNWSVASPDAVAVQYGDATLSYRELNQRANSLARRLRRAGIGVGTMVGISMKRSLEMIVGLLAVLKSGGSYVPLDPRLPRERLHYLVNDAALRVILTRGTRIDAWGADVIDLTADAPKEADTDFDSGATSDDLVYVIYTSGSTGEPKGVMVPHRGVVNWLVWMRNTFEVTPKDVVLKKAPLTFDVSAWELFLPLISGARLVLADSDRQADPAYLAELMAATRVTVAQFVPSLLRPFLEQKNLPDLSPLRHVMCGGEAFSKRLQEMFFERLAAEVCNSYGPTECSIGVTRWPCRRDDQRSSVPIGYAIDNTELYILDENLDPVSPGVAGELFIGGICLGRGYLNRPDLTAERFIPNPFNADDEARMYRTGDLCRFLEDGSIDFIGRIDDQVKIRGVRIELGEVEAFIAQHDAVEVAAAAADDSGGDTVLIAFIVPAAGKAVTDRELRAFLRSKLPLSMIPSEFYFVHTLPISANGKLDRKALRAMRPRDFPVAAEEPAEGRPDDMAQRLRAMWARLLNRDDFTAQDDFFDCGGDSLLAVQLFAEIEKTFGARISLDDVLETLSVDRLCTLLRANSAGAAAAPVIAAPEHRWIGDVVCREATLADIEGIWRVCARAFEPYAHASLEDFRDLCHHRWLNNPSRSADDPFGWVLEKADGGIVGFHGLVPVRVWAKGQVITAASPTTWAADAGYGRAGLALLTTFLEWGADRLLLNTTANAITSAMHRNSNAGMRRVPLSNFDQRLLWVRDFKALSRWKLQQSNTHMVLRGMAMSWIGQMAIGLAAPFALGAVGGMRAAMRSEFGRGGIRFNCPTLAVTEIDGFGPEFDALWDRLKKHFDVATERTARVLNWRHANVPRLLGRSYALACHDGGTLLGYVALRAPSTTAPGHFVITDLFYDPQRPEVMQNLMNGAFEFAIAHGASVVELFGFHPSLNQALRSQHPYVLQRAQLERLGRDPSLRSVIRALLDGGDSEASETYWYRAPNEGLADLCASGAWWPSGIDGDLNL